MSQLLLLLGTSGAGKTTFGEALSRSAPVRYVYATATKLGLLQPGELLNLLDQHRTYEVNAAFFDGLEQGPGTVLVDTHATYPFGDGFVRLTPPSVCPRISGIVFLDCDPLTIQARRLARGRALEAMDLPSIVEELAAERAEVNRLTETYGMPVCALDTATISVGASVATGKRFIATMPDSITKGPATPARSQRTKEGPNGRGTQDVIHQAGRSDSSPAR